VKKIGQNIKYDDIVLRRAGVPVSGYEFDTMLASYLIDPERHTHKLDEISKSELGYEMVSYDSVTKVGKGKQITFDEVDIARATRYAAEDAEVVSRLQERLRPKLGERRAHGAPARRRAAAGAAAGAHGGARRAGRRRPPEGDVEAGGRGGGEAGGRGARDGGPTPST
jgi:hypothetical protein